MNHLFKRKKDSRQVKKNLFVVWTSITDVNCLRQLGYGVILVNLKKSINIVKMQDILSMIKEKGYSFEKEIDIICIERNLADDKIVKAMSKNRNMYLFNTIEEIIGLIK